jgi:lysozyme family protein
MAQRSKVASFELQIEKTLAHEGGDTITDDPEDRGGLTRYGISQKSYPELDISILTERQAKAIYKEDYWDMVKGDRIEAQEVAGAIFDFSVNVGPLRAIKLAQKAVDVDSDGIIGPVTIARFNEISIELFLFGYTIEKIKFYRDIVKRRPSQKKFFMGWLNRSLEGV